jgi:hypothetical protein
MMTSKQSPLYPKVLNRLEKNGVHLPTDVSSSYFLRHESKDNAAVHQFWMEAHALSCLKHRSFHSSVQTTYNDTMASMSESNAVDLDYIRELLAGDSVIIKSDGSVINNSDVQSFTNVISVDGQMNTQQLKTVASLASARLSSNVPKVPPKSKSTLQPASIFEYVTSPVRTVYRGVTYAIDSVLGDEFTQKAVINQGTDLDDVISSPNPTLDKVDEDDELITKKSSSGVTNARPLSNSVAIMSLDAIALSCRCLLDYTNNNDIDEEFLVLRGNSGSVDRIILNKNCCETGSFGSLSQYCGKTCIASTGNDHSEAAKLLSSVSDEDANLILETLIASKYATMDEDSITIFPKGIPPNYSKAQSDAALFQIHTARITIQNRMMSLEQVAKTAQENAVRAKRNGMTKVALMHMKRRKVAIDEIERCAVLISNLDASELRLNRAKDDVQLVETFTLVKTALRDIRTESGLDETNVEELMLDIQEEMDATNIGTLCSGIGPEIDEDELNAEFRQLELECALEKGSGVDERVQVAKKFSDANTEVETDNQEAAAMEDKCGLNPNEANVKDNQSNKGAMKKAHVEKVSSSQIEAAALLPI